MIPFWQTAEVITDFTQVRPNDGTEPSERTEVRIVYDRDAIYLSEPAATTVDRMQFSRP